MRKGEQAPVPGNEAVVALLERWLAVAKEGQVCYAALAMIQMPNKMVADFVGSIEVEMAIEHALDQVKAKIAQVRENRQLPPRDPNLTADYVTYNLSLYPVSYDFLPWMIESEMIRRREGAPAPLKVALRFHERETKWANDVYRSAMYNSVMLPLIDIMGAELIDDVGGRTRDHFTYLETTQAARQGEEVPKIKASESASLVVSGWLEGGPSPVTITLREAEHFPHRNSNIAAWLQFAADLEKRGERVIFLRDANKAAEPLLNQETCPLASVDLDLRTALYEQAKCNLFVANGPWNIALFGDRPWLMFNEVSAGDVFLPNNPGWWLQFQGVEDGGQFPWSAEDQRIVWVGDTYENLMGAWQELQAVQQAA